MESLLGIFAGVYGIYVMFGNVNLGWQARLDRGCKIQSGYNIRRKVDDS
jgi:hypothetical protein